MYSESFPAGRSFIQVLLSCYLSPQVRIATEKGGSDGSFLLPELPSGLDNHGNVRSCTTSLVYVNLSKNSFFCAFRRGVPLVCGCKGRHFFVSHQMFLKKNFRRKVLQRYGLYFIHARNVLNNIYITHQTKT